MSPSFNFDQQNTSGQESASPPANVRYNEQMQQRIIALASQLQHQYPGTASAAELEAIAGEVGIEPVFIRQAIEQATTEAAVSTPLGQQPGFWSNITPWVWRDIVPLTGTLILSVYGSSLSLALPLALGLMLGPKRGGVWVGAAVMGIEECFWSFSTSQPLYLPFHLRGLFYGAFGAAAWALGAAGRGLFNRRRNALIALSEKPSHPAPPTPSL